MDPEKKKTVVVGALFVAMLGIGAFQFSKSGEAPAPAPEMKPETPKAGDEKTSAEKGGKTKNPMYAMALAGRDPFRPAPFSVAAPEEATPVAPVSTPAKKAGAVATPPSTLGGSLPPMSTGEGLPNPGEMGSGGMGSGGMGSGGMGPGLSVPPPKPRFQATLIGVIVGAQSAAVFRLGSSQRIVTVGSEFEPGVRLLTVSPGRAVVRFHGETLTIRLTDEPPMGTVAPKQAFPAPKQASPAPTTAPTLPLPGSPTSSETSND